MRFAPLHCYPRGSPSHYRSAGGQARVTCPARTRTHATRPRTRVRRHRRAQAKPRRAASKAAMERSGMAISDGPLSSDSAGDGETRPETPDSRGICLPNRRTSPECPRIGPMPARSGGTQGLTQHNARPIPCIMRNTAPSSFPWQKANSCYLPVPSSSE